MNLNDAVCETISNLRHLIDTWECGGLCDKDVEGHLDQICFDLERNLEKPVPLVYENAARQLYDFLHNWIRDEFLPSDFTNKLENMLFDLQHKLLEIKKNKLSEHIGRQVFEATNNNIPEKELLEADQPSSIDGTEHPGYTVINFGVGKLEHFSGDIDLIEYLEERFEANQPGGQEFLDENILVFEGIHCPLAVTTSHKIEVSGGKQ